MKKIKLDTSKLKLKKESIGNLLNKDAMRHIEGGVKAGTTPTPTCQCASNGCATEPPLCASLPNCSIGCPASADCTNDFTCSTCPLVVGCEGA